MLLYIIRHGDPDYATDSLTEKGILQAEAVGKRMFNAGIDRIFSSPMGRAKQTAEPACRLLGKEYTVEEWAHEIGREMYVEFPDGKHRAMGYLPNIRFLENGNIFRPYEDYKELYPFNECTVATAHDYIWENGKAFLERLGYKEENGLFRILQPNNEKIALFCHAAFAKSWIAQLLHVPQHIMWGGFSISHTGVTVLEFPNYEGGFTSPRCLCFSDLGHLYAENLPLHHNNRVLL